MGMMIHLKSRFTSIDYTFFKENNQIWSPPRKVHIIGTDSGSCVDSPSIEGNCLHLSLQMFLCQIVSESILQYLIPIFYKLQILAILNSHSLVQLNMVPSTKEIEHDLEILLEINVKQMLFLVVYTHC